MSEIKLTNEDIKALSMIGDINLFKNPPEDPEFEVECEVTIAGRCSTLIVLSPLLLNKQGKILTPLFSRTSCSQQRAYAALVLLLLYVCDKLGMRKESSMARIGSANVRIIALFASLGFEVVRTVSAFDQESRCESLTVSLGAG